LDGRHDELTRELKDRMKTASQNLEFELAGMYRDQLAAVESSREAQRVVVVSDRDQDVLGIYREGDLAELCVMVVRKGRMIDSATFSMKNVELPDDEVVATFLREHYGEGGSGEAHVPDEVVVPVLPEGADGVGEWLMERRAEVVESRRTKVEVLAPARGPRRALLDMANENAKHAFEEKRRAADDVDERLARVQERLRLPTLPRRIECCDISHLGGADTVGAVVALLNGQPDKKRYRTYIVRTVGEGDDYGAMFEVLSRRFRRGKAAREKRVTASDEAAMTLADPAANLAAQPASDEAAPVSASEADILPDLFVVDGGRGQLGVALAAAHDLGLHDLCIVGLAKEKENVAGDKLTDRVYLPGQKNPIALRPNSPELFMLARARDEAHRFSNRGRSKVGKRRRFESELDSIAGIGPKTRTSLLKTLGSLTALRAASDEQILAVPGVTERHLRALREAFARKEPTEKPEEASPPSTPVVEVAGDDLPASSEPS
jgi:excinuclease ABC subunit C